MATLCADTNVILKLDLGDKGGIRRIAFAKLWDPSTSTVSYERLSAMALQHSNLSDKNLHRVTVTYTDEDGDTITISTDDELKDAFEQFAESAPPILRAKASFDSVRDEKKLMKGLKTAVSEIGETVKKGGQNKKVDQIQGVLESFVTILTQAVDSLAKNVDDIKQKKKSRSKPVPQVIRTTEKNEGATCKMEKEVEETDSPLDLDNKKQEVNNILSADPHLDKSFIHGRHTCDGCLVTPIVGLRYHALNLPDHDLCEKCVQTHKGKDIIFEATELERDRYLQNKWKRRHWRQNSCPVKTCGKPNVISNLAVCNDTDLKEAIRRSLEDVKPSNDDTEPENEGTTVHENKVTQERSEDDDKKVSVTEDKQTEFMTETEKCTIEDDDEGVSYAEPTLATKDDDVSYSEAGTEASETELMEDQKQLDHKEVEEVVDVAANSPQPEVIDDQDQESLNIKKSEENSHQSKKSNDSSFTEDAEGQGDVAIAIGRALDMTANAIDSVLSEAEKEVNDIQSESQPKSGCTILESANQTKTSEDLEDSSQTQSSVESNDSWQLLNDEGKATSDEMIAQAAQLLGSALFQSDVISDVTDAKDESMVTATEHSIHSGPSNADTVPTNIPSIVPSAISTTVLSRWDTELKQMHELGFLNDVKNVNALEHLEAANMGVDSDDPVTVDGAINYLLSEYRDEN